MDTYSTCNVTNNLALVTNIRAYYHQDKLIDYTNSGAQTYKHLVDMKILPLKVFYKQNLIANIIIVKSVVEIPGVRLVMETSKNMNITLHFANKTSM